MSALKNFNRDYLQHLPNRDKLATKLAYFLRETPDQLDQFVIGNTDDNLETVDFFRNLNNLLLTDDTNYDFLWDVFRVIEIAIKNKSTRQYLVDTVRIIRGISNFAVNVSALLVEQKQIKVWTLVEKITKGISILVEEQHLTNLIDYLVTSIKETELPKEIKTIQVSILTNLCFKNEMAIACLLRFTKSKDLLNHTKEIRVLYSKLAFAMARFDHTKMESELVTTLKFVFEVEYFLDLMRSNDQRLLYHILELLDVCRQRDEHSRQTMQNYDFKENFDGVITLVDSWRAEANEKNNLRNSRLMRLFLGIVNSMLTVGNTSLESSIPRLLKLAIDSTGTTDSSSEAIHTIRLIASNGNLADSQDLLLLITGLIENIEAHHSDLLVASEIYQLLTILHAKYPSLINQLPEKIINKSIDADSWSFKLTDCNLSMQIYRLQWFLNYINEGDSTKLSDVMKNREVHHIFATGLRNTNDEICTLTMTMIRSKHFPLDAVSKVMSCGFSSNFPRANQSHGICQCKSTVEVIRPCFSTSLEKRVNTAVDKLMQKMNEVKSVEKFEHSSMLEYQNIIGNSKEKVLQSQLKASSDMITLQSNEIGGLRLIIRNYQNKINELELKIENSERTVSKLSTGFNTLKAKYDDKEMRVKDLAAKGDLLMHDRNAILRDKNKLDQHIENLKTEREKDIQTFKENLKQQKDAHDQEKELLKEQHRRDLESRLAERNKTLIAKHEKELGEYSRIHNQLKENFEQEKTKMETQRTKEMAINASRIDDIEKELAEKAKQCSKYTKEIAEKNKILIEKEDALEKTRKELEQSNAKAAAVIKIFKGQM